MSKEIDVTKNKAIYFVLPMLGLNKSSFGADNFITCMLDKTGYIVVNTKEEIIINPDNIYSHENFVTDYQTREKSFNYVFNVPNEHIEDARMFTEGRYSQLSAKLKIAISKMPGVSNRVLSSLNPQHKDKAALADELGVPVGHIKELVSVPGESNFISIK